MKLILLILFLIPCVETGVACTPNVSTIMTNAMQGRVVDSNRAAIPDASVEVYLHKNSDERIIASTTTDSIGRFTIPSLPKGRYSIRAKAEYFRTSYASMTLIGPAKDHVPDDVIFELVVGDKCSGDVSVKTLDRKQLAEQVKTEFLHAWNGYKQHCWGHDDLKPRQVFVSGFKSS